MIINNNNSYVIEVSETYTHDGSTNNAHYNEAAISRALFDYTVSPTAPLVPINIPMVDSSGVFHFNMSVSAGVTTYIDPEIATGYIYAIGAGNPDFASVTLPILPNQTDPYEIEWDGGLETAFVSGGQVFDFTGAGVSNFEVNGIDLANGLSPTNPTAFVTALTFEGAGMFTGTMTPISVNIPEPSTWAMMLFGFVGLGFVGYRRAKKGLCNARPPA
jgi:PEP-CTERM motif